MPAAVVLGYNYAERRAVLEEGRGAEPSPHAYGLCVGCADRLQPPRGWTLDDRRASPALFLAAAAGRSPGD